MNHVGLNMIFLVPGETGGMDVAARALASALTRVAPALRVTAFVAREAGYVDLGVDRAVVRVRARRRTEWVRGEQVLLPRLARRAGCDLVHSLASTAPLAGRFARVVTVHDLHYLVAPDAHFGVRGLGMRVLVPLAARRSHRVIVDFEHTRTQLVERVGIEPGKIDVVRLGPGRPAEDTPTPAHELRERLALGTRRVVLALSAKRAHKNLAGLLDALALIPAGRRPALVLPGYPTPHELELRRRADTLGIADAVRFEGWLPPADVDGLFGLADCLVMPSFHEGFGLPVVEAMTRGVPVACSDRPAVRAVAGDAALLFDPARPTEIAAAIERLLADRELAARLVERGREQAARFSWDATASLCLESYERALASAAAR